MKKSNPHLRYIVNYLNDQIRERYPNLFNSLDEYYVRETLEDLVTKSNSRMIPLRIKTSRARNATGNIFHVQNPR